MKQYLYLTLLVLFLGLCSCASTGERQRLVDEASKREAIEQQQMEHEVQAKRKLEERRAQLANLIIKDNWVVGPSWKMTISDAYLTSEYQNVGTVVYPLADQSLVVIRIEAEGQLPFKLDELRIVDTNKSAINLPKLGMRTADGFPKLNPSMMFAPEQSSPRDMSVLSAPIRDGKVVQEAASKERIYVSSIPINYAGEAYLLFPDDCKTALRFTIRTSELKK